MGGEKLLSEWGQGWPLGSPPRGRGKVIAHLHKHVLPGITPAWAGKSCIALRRSVRCGDHPRVGGEKHGTRRNNQIHKGSPPRGRGKDQSSCNFGLALGITPAWAGKSYKCPVGLLPTWDHPRVGGEKNVEMLKTMLKMGSPPRGRGKGNLPPPASNGMGITPAWAGKRLKRSHRSGIFISGPIPFHSVLHRPAGSGGSRAGRDGSPAGQPQNTGPA